jgi:hypothetical protein
MAPFPALQAIPLKEYGIKPRAFSLPQPKRMEPFPGAWVQEGDLVEARYKGIVPGT